MANVYGSSFLLVGAICFLAAGIAILLRDTRGLPLRSRCFAMVAKTWRGFVWMVTRCRCVRVGYAFIAGFVGGFLVSGLICLGVLCGYAATLPPATGDFGDFGAVMILYFFSRLGLLLSVGVGFITAFILASATHQRLYGPEVATPVWRRRGGFAERSAARDSFGNVFAMAEGYALRCAKPPRRR